MMMMKAASKSMDTLVRLSAIQQYDDEDSFSHNAVEPIDDDGQQQTCDESEMYTLRLPLQTSFDNDDDEEEDVDSDIGECDLFHNVIEYHPEELFELAPLRPEEANECELADMFASYGSDLDTFLFDGSASSTSSSSSAAQPASPPRPPSIGSKRSAFHHCIPSDWILDDQTFEDEESTRSAKRARLSFD